ncbi:MAG: hypothetical protein AAGE94_14320 [Acidobacteriota bacterium]
MLDRSTLLTGLFVVAALFGAASDAAGCTPCFWQGDRKIIPGSECDIRLDSESTSWGIDWRGGICNLSFSEPLKVSCPVGRDNTQNQNGLECAEPYFYWESYADTAHCVLYARQASGSGSYYSTSHTGPAATGSTSIGLHINNSYTRGYYHMTCLIPQKAGNSDYSCLRSFQWGEPNPTD